MLRMNVICAPTTDHTPRSRGCTSSPENDDPSNAWIFSSAGSAMAPAAAAGVWDYPPLAMSKRFFCSCQALYAGKWHKFRAWCTCFLPPN